MKIKTIYRFLLNPRKVIEQKANDLAEKQLRKLNFIPINETKEKDIFIVAFPKSGITWLRTLLAGLQYGIDTKFLPDKLVNELIPDIYVSKYYKRFGDIKLFKSHELPNPRYKNVIYLVRDGRDALVSYYHFNKKIGQETSLEQMVKFKRNIYPTSWKEHVNQWIKNPYNSRIIYIRYEDLLTDTFSVLKNLLDFIGIDRDDELINRVIKGATIDKMRENAEKYGGLDHPWWTGKKGKDFFRKGKKETYLEEMPFELIERLTQDSENELKHFNYETNLKTILAKIHNKNIS